MRKLGAILTALTLAGCVPPVEVGRTTYADTCAACHGPAGKGDGPLAGEIGKLPPDLSTLSARNGGTFPKVYVMSVVDGYTRRGNHASLMPEFGTDLGEGDLVLVPTGEGINTPTPKRIVAIAAFLETLQE
jgi:mono/diheme cytochrome c family protein